ncbi:hypothetical protein GGI20_006204, partial [Coemansia sp. BCRC 34301]
AILGQFTAALPGINTLINDPAFLASISKQMGAFNDMLAKNPGLMSDILNGKIPTELINGLIPTDLLDDLKPKPTSSSSSKPKATPTSDTKPDDDKPAKPDDDKPAKPDDDKPEDDKPEKPSSATNLKPVAGGVHGQGWGLFPRQRQRQPDEAVFDGAGRFPKANSKNPIDAFIATYLNRWVASAVQSVINEQSSLLFQETRAAVA